MGKWWHYDFSSISHCILSDLPLIEGLEKTKAASEEIALAVEKAKVTEIEINLAREEYRPAASESSMLYFLITE